MSVECFKNTQKNRWKGRNFNEELKSLRNEPNGYYRTEKNQIKISSNGFNSTHDSGEHITNEFKDRSIKTFQIEAVFKTVLKINIKTNSRREMWQMIKWSNESLLLSLWRKGGRKWGRSNT